MLGMISIFLNLPRLDLWPRMWSILEKVLCALEKRWNSLFWGEMSYRYQVGLTGPLYHLKFVSLLIFCLVYLSIGVSGIFKSPTIIVLLLISLFILVSICLTYCRAPVGCTYIYSCCIFFVDWSFDHYVASFFVSFHGLFFKVYFICYEYCYSCYLLVYICTKYLFPALHFQSVCVPWFEVGLLKTAYGNIFLYPFR